MTVIHNIHAGNSNRHDLQYQQKHQFSSVSIVKRNDNIRAGHLIYNRRYANNCRGMTWLCNGTNGSLFFEGTVLLKRPNDSNRTWMISYIVFSGFDVWILNFISASHSSVVTKRLAICTPFSSHCIILYIFSHRHKFHRQPQQEFPDCISLRKSHFAHHIRNQIFYWIIGIDNLVLFKSQMTSGFRAFHHD